MLRESEQLTPIKLFIHVENGTADLITPYTFLFPVPKHSFHHEFLKSCLWLKPQYLKLPNRENKWTWLKLCFGTWSFFIAKSIKIYVQNCTVSRRRVSRRTVRRYNVRISILIQLILLSNHIYFHVYTCIHIVLIKRSYKHCWDRVGQAHL